MFYRLMRHTPDAKLRRVYRSRILGVVRVRFSTPAIYFFYSLKCAMHYHHHKMTNDMIENPQKFVSSFGKAMRTEDECSPAPFVPMPSSPVRETVKNV